VLSMVIVLSVLAGALSALVPAVQASRRDVADGLRAAAGGITRSTARVRGALTMVQAALSVLLLVGAGLFVRSLDRIHNTDFGLSLWEVAYLSPTFHAGSAEAEERWLYFERAAERVARLPGVSATAVASGIPFWSAYAHRLRADGLDSIPRAPTGGPYANAVDNDYFRTMGVRLQRGRLFDERDAQNAPRVVVVNASFAQALWPGEDALGRCLYIGDDDVACSEIVGVVHDARRGSLVEETTYQYYMPLVQRQANRRPDGLLVRVPASMQQTLGAVQREMLATDARVRFVRSMPLEELVARELRQWRLGAAMFSLFGLLALLVAAIGLYSVLAFDVAQRVREIGLRSALGATNRAIMTLVVSRALRITVVGVAAGVVLAFALAPRLGDMLYQTSPRDPLTFAAVALTLIVASLVAAAMPAWRAARVDPNVALRAD
jgi:predicted permease